MNLPKQIEALVGRLDFTRDTLGRSEDEIYLFEDKYVLKISENTNRLKREHDRCVWLDGKLSVPKSRCFVIENGRAYFLREMLVGKPLCDEKYMNDPMLAVSLLSEAFLMLRRVDVEECPFESEENSGEDFVHGDFCLPNILIKDDHVAGFIDIENCGRGDKRFDIAWAVWSLGYNLGTNKYTNDFLDKIGCDFSRDDYERYVLDLIDTPENRGKYIEYLPEKYR